MHTDKDTKFYHGPTGKELSSLFTGMWHSHPLSGLTYSMLTIYLLTTNIAIQSWNNRSIHSYRSKGCPHFGFEIIVNLLCVSVHVCSLLSIKWSSMVSDPGSKSYKQTPMCFNIMSLTFANGTVWTIGWSIHNLKVGCIGLSLWAGPLDIMYYNEMVECQQQ